MPEKSLCNADFSNIFLPFLNSKNPGSEFDRYVNKHNRVECKRIASEPELMNRSPEKSLFNKVQRFVKVLKIDRHNNGRDFC